MVSAYYYIGSIERDNVFLEIHRVYLEIHGVIRYHLTISGQTEVEMIFAIDIFISILFVHLGLHTADCRQLLS